MRAMYDIRNAKRIGYYSISLNDSNREHKSKEFIVAFYLKKDHGGVHLLVVRASTNPALHHRTSIPFTT